jgi:alkylhydroperoxidase/carboxymuconolactone decarboxylase family protein YurZ
MPASLDHIQATLNVGARKQGVAEIIFQMLTYDGVPTMVEGLKVAKEELPHAMNGGRNT